MRGSIRQACAKSPRARDAEAELQELNKTLEQRAEERANELAASAIKFEETERRFRMLVEGVTDYAIYMLDPTGVVINWNPARSGSRATRATKSSASISPASTPRRTRKGRSRKGIRDGVRTGKYEAEGWRVRKDGTQFWASVVINAIRDSDGELMGFAKITRDLTERRADRRASAPITEDGRHRPAHGRRCP